MFLHGGIAQLVEQRTENPRVLGSIPSLATLLRSSCITACWLADCHVSPARLAGRTKWSLAPMWGDVPALGGSACGGKIRVSSVRLPERRPGIPLKAGQVPTLPRLKRGLATLLRSEATQGGTSYEENPFFASRFYSGGHKGASGMRQQTGHLLDQLPAWAMDR